MALKHFRLQTSTSPFVRREEATEQVKCPPFTPLIISVPGATHFDRENLPLVDAKQLGEALSNNYRKQRVLYVGCGTGVLGLLALRYKLCSFVHFSDIDSEALESARRNAQNNGYKEGESFRASILNLNNNDPLSNLPRTVRFDVILCNPPQMPGPKGLGSLRPDKYAGKDGMLYYRRLAYLAEKLSPTRVVFMQTSFSSFPEVDRIFHDIARLKVRTVHEQERKASIKAISALCPGQFKWLQDLQKLGSACFKKEAGDIITYSQRLAVALSENMDHPHNTGTRTTGRISSSL
mmetsp:Transcript_23132/g.32332  ORF Transcript_23132/g.32332 Transcript_23132/m.32332 type:complete len:293 (-) Transcript_23132:131-1009(-)|eukprot:CAMPEP_0185257250 /NCGR_PEP_ID=MMETSP1359-20130426/6312_1 /TAXON_ID=552665 /ORGANISM="Bigelowiella longifila, Strain CCMP242" /LENGTH=292 /DNA_ID=CAMNT_0027842239 /DNA_START=95 /DNA_END=973 /DNA_ORIENTATION=-